MLNINRLYLFQPQGCWQVCFTQWVHNGSYVCLLASISVVLEQACVGLIEPVLGIFLPNFTLSDTVLVAMIVYIPQKSANATNHNLFFPLVSHYWLTTGVYYISNMLGITEPPLKKSHSPRPALVSSLIWGI